MPLTAEGLTVTAKLREGAQTIVSSLSFRAETGSTLAVVGESGCGKTMTALAVMGLLPPNCRAEGSVTLDGKELIGLSQRKLSALRGREICFVPQSGAEFLNPSLKVSTQLYESLARQGVPRERRRTEACERLERAGLDSPETFLSRYPFELSGGQAQKVVLAAACGKDVRLLIADEPTKGIDRAGADAFLGSVRKLFPSAAVIVITHDISVASGADELLVMLRGRAMESGRASDVIARPRHPYTMSLLDALPSRGLTARPALRETRSSGCPFYPFCPVAENRCQAFLPPAKEEDVRMTRCFVC